jgi:hypothetical protein
MKQSIAPHKERMDCFVASLLAMTIQNAPSRSRGAMRPGCTEIIRPNKKRAQGMPGARCTRGLVCKVVRKNAHEHTGSAETLRHSPRNGFTAYAVLGDEFVLSPSSAD